MNRYHGEGLFVSFVIRNQQVVGSHPTVGSTDFGQVRQVGLLGGSPFLLYLLEISSKCILHNPSSNCVDCVL
jgi:hypothetical protein